MSDQFWFWKNKPEAAERARQKREPEPSEPPTEYVLWGRVEQSGAGYIAIASAVPRLDSKRRVFTTTRFHVTEDAAQTALGVILREIGDQARAEGHTVVDVETDGL